MPLGQTTMLYLYVNSVFTFTRVPILWNVNVLLEGSLEAQWIIRQDAKEMDGTVRSMLRREMKMSKPSFLQSSEIFSCVCSSVGKWLGTKTTDSVKSKIAKWALEGRLWFVICWGFQHKRIKKCVKRVSNLLPWFQTNFLSLSLSFFLLLGSVPVGSSKGG